MFNSQVLIPLLTLIVCVLLWVDCWRAEKLLPLFGSVRRARVIWSLTFLFVNPLMLLLYLAIARKQWFVFRVSNRRDQFILTGLVLAAWLQWPSGTPEYEQSDRTDVGALTSQSAYLGLHFWIADSTWHNTSPATANEEKPTIHEVRITASRDPLSWAIADRAAGRFSDENFAERIVIVPRAIGDAPCSHKATELCIDIDAGDVEIIRSPFLNSFQGDVQIGVALGMPLDESFANQEGHPHPLTWDTTRVMSLEMSRVGIPLSGGDYGQPADVTVEHLFGEQFFRSIRERTAPRRL